MIYLISGTPGAGKTLRGVEMLSKFVADGREVYANVDGLNMPGVRAAPGDWRDTPKGSVICYDEAHSVFKNDRAYGSNEPPHINALRLHRHDGYDLVLITQAPNDLHKTVRTLVFRHEHLQRVFGAETSVIYWRDRCFDVESRRERDSASQENWMFPKKLYGVYKSATMHVKPRRVPGGVKLYVGIGVVCLLALPLLAWRFFHTAEEAKAARQDNVEQTAEGEEGSILNGSSVGGGAAAWKTQAVVMGCAWTQAFCQCYSGEGLPIEEDGETCYKRVSGPLPWNAKPEFKAGEPAQRAVLAGPTGPAGGARPILAEGVSSVPREPGLN